MQLLTSNNSGHCQVGRRSTRGCCSVRRRNAITALFCTPGTNKEPDLGFLRFTFFLPELHLGAESLTENLRTSLHPEGDQEGASCWARSRPGPRAAGGKPAAPGALSGPRNRGGGAGRPPRPPKPTKWRADSAAACAWSPRGAQHTASSYQGRHAGWGSPGPWEGNAVINSGGSASCSPSPGTGRALR